MNFWFSSDHHFGHANIIKYCKRPFKSVEHMNIELIRRWNERVKKNDSVLYLGDFCFSKKPEDVDYFKSQLNGDITFIWGSHDKKNKIKSVIKACYIVIGGVAFTCCHEPAPRTKYNLCGHVHEKWKVKAFGNKTVLNVGVDQWDFYPIDIKQILEAFKEFKRKAKDGILLSSLHS